MCTQLCCISLSLFHTVSGRTNQFWPANLETSSPNLADFPDLKLTLSSQNQESLPSSRWAIRASWRVMTHLYNIHIHTVFIQNLDHVVDWDESSQVCLFQRLGVSRAGPRLGCICCNISGKKKLMNSRGAQNAKGTRVTRTRAGGSGHRKEALV